MLRARCVPPFVLDSASSVFRSLDETSSFWKGQKRPSKPLNSTTVRLKNVAFEAFCCCARLVSGSVARVRVVCFLLARRWPSQNRIMLSELLGYFPMSSRPRLPLGPPGFWTWFALAWFSRLWAFWAFPGFLERCGFSWVFPGSCALLGFPGASSRVSRVSGLPGLFLVFRSLSGFFWAFPGFVGPPVSPVLSWALRGSPGLSWALLGPPGLSWACSGTPGSSGSPVIVYCMRIQGG